ncbi:MAG: DNA-processing protein DprA [Patescibacteria group bacterium]|nr:DNA-processing protein DprA [Patescibacteria group bacterium]
MLDFWVWMYTQPGVGSKKLKSLISKYGVNVSEALWAKIAIDVVPMSDHSHDLSNRSGGLSNCSGSLSCSSHVLSSGSGALSRSWTPANIAKDIDKIKVILENYETRVIPFWSDSYPFKLKQIPDNPVFLFLKGKLCSEVCWDKSVAIIGTRAMTSYGKDVLMRLVQPLAGKEIAVVSGLASGVDAEAHHQLILNDNLRACPIVVLPGGPCSGFPEMNRNLYDIILKKGIIVSEYFPGTSIKPGMFVSRNRIIAGLSDCVVVVEAPAKSGALITADFALDYNREVGAVPGSVFSRVSEGTNSLLKQGAFIVRDGYDILEVLDYNVDDKSRAEGISMKYVDELASEFGISQSLACRLHARITQGNLDIVELGKVVSLPVTRIRCILTRLEVNGILRLSPLGIIIFV